MTDPYIISNVKVLFTFKFDLCNTMKLETKEDVDVLQTELKKLYPENDIENPTYKYFTRSYLSIKDPILILNPSQVEEKMDVEIGEKKFSLKFNQIIKLYPSQGIISNILVYSFTNISVSELKAFYDFFNDERESAYTSYLIRNECAKKWLRECIEKRCKVEKECKEEDNFSQLQLNTNLYGIIESIRNLKLTSEKLEYIPYFFESFRVIFIIKDKISETCPFLADDKSNSEKTDYSKILALIKGAEITKMPDEVVRATILKTIAFYRNKFILTGDWATAFLVEDDEEFEYIALFLFDYAHSLWYVCQKWIFILRDNFTYVNQLLSDIQVFKTGINDNYSYQRLIEKYNQRDINFFTNNISNIYQSLMEAKDVDLMIYNSEYRKIMQKYYDFLMIIPHIALVESNLTILEECHQRLKDDLVQKLNFETSNDSKSLNVLLAGASGLALANIFNGVKFPFIQPISENTAIFLGFLFFLLFIIISWNNSKIFKHYYNYKYDRIKK